MRTGFVYWFMLLWSSDHDAGAVLGPDEVRERSAPVKAGENRRCPEPRPGAQHDVHVLRQPARASQQVLVIRRVTTYGSMLAFGRRSSM